ncbi:hypothetical protein FACS189479_05680 [Spirochaetia bacterium]|nr:hypothetical protein FACS189479_05680 [Spirochaetia bacterium]
MKMTKKQVFELGKSAALRGVPFGACNDEVFFELVKGKKMDSTADLIHAWVDGWKSIKDIAGSYDPVYTDF